MSAVAESYTPSGSELILGLLAFWIVCYYPQTSAVIFSFKLKEFAYLYLVHLLSELKQCLLFSRNIKCIASSV